MADTVAVMNHGRIEQMGAPAALYDLPQTAFVANFVGQSNMGTGPITDQDGDHVVAEISGTKVRIPKNRTAVTSGQVAFGVRPEKVRIHDHEPAGVGNDVRATVTDVSFTGVATQYLVTVASGSTWSVYEQNLDVEPVHLAPGDDVWLSWDPGHSFGVPADEDAIAAAKAAAVEEA